MKWRNRDDKINGANREEGAMGAMQGRGYAPGPHRTHSPTRSRVRSEDSLMPNLMIEGEVRERSIDLGSFDFSLMSNSNPSLVSTREKYAKILSRVALKLPLHNTGCPGRARAALMHSTRLHLIRQNREMFSTCIVMGIAIAMIHLSCNGELVVIVSHQLAYL